MTVFTEHPCNVREEKAKTDYERTVVEYKLYIHYAFLDNGSSATLLEKATADELAVGGKALSLCMQWTSGIDKKVSTTHIANLNILEPGSPSMFQLSEIYTPLRS